LENYYQLEDPRFVPQPNPIENEIWVQANLSLDPTNGSTGSNPKPCSDQEENDGKEDRFLVRGIVDRLDYVAVLSSARDVFNQSGNHNGEKAIMTAVRITKLVRHLISSIPLQQIKELPKKTCGSQKYM